MKIEIEYAVGAGGSQVAKYIGYGPPGSLTSQAVWRILRMTYDVNDNPTVVEWANGNINFVNIWDDRAGLSYS